MFARRVYMHLKPNGVKVDELEAPQRAIAGQKKEADAIELTRQKNQKSFRP